jgi:5-methyltetrahydropteroyltriglutamate--homocysteine methyltransferase
MLKPEPTVEAYRQFARRRIDAVNHALAGIPEERVRYHLCWGSWHGPHTHDLPLEHIIDLIIEVKAQTSTGWESRARSNLSPTRSCARGSR